MPNPADEQQANQESTTTDDSTPSDGEDGSNDEEDIDDDDPSDEKAAVGELIEGEEVELVVVDWRRESTHEGLLPAEDETSGIGVSDDDHRTARDGHEFLIVELAVKNASQEAFRSVDDLLPSLRDPDDRALSHRESTAARILETNRLAPGEIERVELVYELPVDTPATVLEFTAEEGERSALDRSAVELNDWADTIASLEQDLRVPLWEFGESVERDDVTVSFDQLELGNDIQPFSQPEDDHQHVVVGFTVTNESGTEIELSPLEQFHLKDEVGRNYPTDSDLVSSIEQFDEGSLEDEESRTGKLAYEVERDLDELYWIGDFSQWGDGERTIWQLR